MKINGKTLPPPGLRGDYRDSCAVCLRGTDTGLAFTGEAEFAAAGLSRLGLPGRDAVQMVGMLATDGADMDNMMVPVRVCASCADKAGLPIGVLPEVPLLRSRTGEA